MKNVKLIAVMLLVVLGLVSILSSAAVSQQVGEAQQDTHNSSSLLLIRYQCLKGAVGAVRQLGYISSDTGDPSWENPYVRYYYFAQFSLAPLLLSNGIADNTLVIGFYPDASKVAYVMGRFNLTLVKDCGEGVLLLKLEGAAQ